MSFLLGNWRIMTRKKHRQAEQREQRARLLTGKISPIIVYEASIEGHLLRMWRLGKRLARQTVALARGRTALRSAERRERMMRLIGPHGEPHSTSPIHDEARDQLRYDRIEQGYRYERSSSRDSAVYQPPQRRDHSGAKRARLAGQADMRRARARRYDPRAFNPRTGGFGMWTQLDRMPATGAPVAATQSGVAWIRELEQILHFSWQPEPRTVTLRECQLPLYHDFTMRDIKHGFTMQ
jgi:hypothetical protein